MKNIRLVVCFMALILIPCKVFATTVELGAEATLNVGSDMASTLDASASGNKVDYRIDPSDGQNISAIALDNNEIIPVTLLRLAAELVVAEGVRIAWETIREVNNDYFTVERSADGLKYSKLMILKGSGDSDMSRSYAVFDRYPLIGDSYYRLKQTNFDGTSKTFDPVLIRNTFKSKLSVYPNPFSTESLMIAGRGNINENTLVTVSDLSGRAIGVKKVYKNNSIQLTFPTDIEPGVYITTISTPGYTTQTIRIVR